MTKLALKVETLDMHDSANSSLSAQSKFGITRLQPFVAVIIQWQFVLVFRIPNNQAKTLTMSDKIPTIQALEKPEKLENILRQDRGDDCLPCKVVGKFLEFGGCDFLQPRIT
jgi:hypothetical protein